MKQLVCEMCGGTDLVKDGGVFICQTCGCKYSVEEAKKMMVEGTVEVAGTVRVDNSGQIENYLKMARTAHESENYKDSEEYANKIIEIDPNNTDAWFIKGQAAAWDNRVREGIECWAHAIDGVDEEKKKEYDALMTHEIQEVLKAQAYVKASSFGHYPSVGDRNILCDLSYVDGSLNMVREKLNIDTSPFEDALYDSVAEAMNKGTVMGWKTAGGLRGSTKEERNRYAYEAWFEMAVLCVDVAKAAIKCTRGEEELTVSYNNYKIMQEDIINSESYKMTFVLSIPTYVTDTKLTDAARAERETDLKETTEFYENKKKEIGSRHEKEKEERKKAYWEANADLKNQLESEKKALCAQIETLETQITDLPEVAEIKDLEGQIESAQKEKDGLGLFKGKEKKALQERIDDYSVKLTEAKKAKDNAAAPIESTIADCKKRIAEIEEEFSKER